MSEITKSAIDAVEKELAEKENNTLEEKIEAEVQKRLSEKAEADKATAEKLEKELAEKNKEEELVKKLAEHENKTRELEKQIEGIKMRKSIPAEDIPTQPKTWKDFSDEEKIKLQKDYVSQTIGMKI